MSLPLVNIAWKEATKEKVKNSFMELLLIITQEILIQQANKKKNTESLQNTLLQKGSKPDEV